MVTMNWSASSQLLTIKARMNKATLAGMLPYSPVDGTVTNAVCTSVHAGKYLYYAESYNPVVAKTKRGTATLKYKR